MIEPISGSIEILKPYSINNEVVFKMKFTEILASSTENFKIPLSNITWPNITGLKVYNNSSNYDVSIYADILQESNDVNYSTVYKTIQIDKLLLDNKLSISAKNLNEVTNPELYLKIKNNDSISTGEIYLEISVISYNTY